MKNIDSKAAFKAIKKQLRSTEKTVVSAHNKTTTTVKDSAIIDDDKKLFSDAVGKVKPMVIDTIHYVKTSGKSKRPSDNKKTDKMVAQFHFSDEFEPNLTTQGPMKYVREGVDSFEVKNLRRGHYTPDLILDLHGLDQHKAKKELAALLYACQKEHAQCICVVHGIGSHVLKNKVPHWLVQHPDVMAFHQAPLEWGGNGALLALIELKDKFNRD
ncbi:MULTISPECIES: endonuclease SmrB [Colwellia]|nr:endonuclease SmrB [Colwellia sp. D2M02]